LNRIFAQGIAGTIAHAAPGFEEKLPCLCRSRHLLSVDVRLARSGPGSPPRRRARRIAALTLAVGLAGVLSCRGGCAGARPERRPLGGRLALFPIETQLVVALDVAKVRPTPVAAKLAALAAGTAADQRQLDGFKERTGFDPLKEIDRVMIGLPDEARRQGEIGVVIRASRLDERRLVAYLRDTLQESGDDLVSTTRGHRTLWSPRKDPNLAGFFLDDHTLVIGGGGWAARMADLSDGAPASGSAETNLELVQLCERASVNHAIWAAAIVPAEVRRKLKADPQLATAASVMHMALGIDLGKGLDALLLADLNDAGDAQALVGKVTETLHDAKRNPQVLMLGLGPDLDGISSKAEGRSFQLRLALDEAQIADLLNRAEAFLSMARQGHVPGFGAR
jgi:hypothetical protein